MRTQTFENSKTSYTVDNTLESSQTFGSRGFAILVLLLATLTALGPLSIDMYLPAFPQIAGSLGVSVDEVQLSLTSFFIGLAVGQVLYGPFVDRYGRMPAIYFGVGAYALASIACALAPTSHVLIFTRFLQALGACGGMVVSRTIVRDLFKEQDAARVFSLLMLVMGIAPILAPVLGGFISSSFGWRYLFYILTGAACLILVLIARYFPAMKGANPLMPMSRALSTYLSIARGRRFLGFAVSGSIAQAGMFAYITGSPFVFIELFKIPAESFGWVFGTNAVGLIAASQINVRLLKGRRPEQLLRVSFLVLALSGACTLAGVFLNARGSAGLFTLLVPLFVFIATLGLTLPNTTAAALAAEGARAGSASALLGTIQFTCAALSSGAVSFFHNGTALPMVTVIAIAGILSLLVFTWTRKSLAEQTASV